MPFQLKVSNSLIHLAENLSKLMAHFKGSVFDPVTVVTQTEGMNSWLKIKLAEHSGIAANIRFYKPNDLITRIYFLLGGEFAQVFSGRNLEWLLYKQLGEDDFIAKHPEISEYYESSAITKDVKRIALADVVADLFDQYQIYRPDMIHNWNQEKIKFENERWQMELWNATKSFANEDFTDKISISNYIKNALNDPEKIKRLQDAMPSIYLFGISVLTEYHMDIFQSLAPHLDIQIFILNPAPEEYWLDDLSPRMTAFLKKIGRLAPEEESTGNQLLTSWGKIIRDTFSLLFANEELINAYEPLSLKNFKENSLLHKIQNLISQNKQLPPNHFTEQDLEDGSITVSSCQSAAREVEILYNYLVHLVVQKKQQLSSRDILVMVSDIDAYASYIRAVFDNAPYKFDYTIADESYASLNSISNALVSLMSISESNFTSENILRLLDFSCIKKGLGISNIDLIRRTLEKANIRFGIEGEKEDDTYLLSWKYGMQRIIYGIAMAGENEYGEGEDSFFPLDNLESKNAYDVIKFCHFVDSYIHLIQDRAHSKTISGWVEHVRKLLELFIPSNKEIPDEDYGALLLQLEQYNSVNKLMQDDVAYGVFLRAFGPTLGTTKRSATFAGEGITFCSLIPMRSIPFKVVAMLGLNSNIFPRKEEKMQLDLMLNEKRKGDRNLKENDKHLFLETLNSAGDFFYLSYIGQNPQDNSPLPSSGLIDELLDFIERGSQQPKHVREQLVTIHPIHRFSHVYSSGDDRYYSYLLESSKQMESIFLKEKEEAFDFSTISVKDLISFTKEPLKYYYHHVLKIYLDDHEISLSDTELIELNFLEEWKLKQHLLQIDEKEIESYLNQEKKKGTLPLKNIAPIVLQKNLNEISAIKEIFQGLRGGFIEKILEIDFMVGEHRIVGEIGNIYGNKVIHICTSKNELKYQMSCYLTHLILSASGYAHEIYFLSCIEEKKFDCVQLSKEKALEQLEKIISLFKTGHTRKILFVPSVKINFKNLDNLNKEGLKNDLEKSNKDRENNYRCQYLKRHLDNHDSCTELELSDLKLFYETFIAPIATFLPK